ncbi:MAG: transketolase C-terminal domain-containing protein [Steroidobacteraceae bacterium]
MPVSVQGEVATLPGRGPGREAWLEVLRQVLTSRQLDTFEETLVPRREVLYQFSARGHELSQCLLAAQLDHPADGVTVYYRSRPLMLGLGLAPEEALAATLMRAGSMSEGRDIGVVFNRPGDGRRATVLPSCGGVGAQYTPAIGWAQSLRYRATVLREPGVERAIAVAHGGDASTATNGFWSALNVATTRRLPLLFFIEDNGYGISVPAGLQTPGGDIARNLSGFQGLRIIEADATEPQEAAVRIATAVAAVRDGEGPVLLRVLVPRLNGHSYQDNQAYKSASVVALERARDPLVALRRLLVPRWIDDAGWQSAEARAAQAVEAAYAAARGRPGPDAGSVQRFRFAEAGEDGAPLVQAQGGLAPLGLAAPTLAVPPQPQGPRINMASAIRQTLESELRGNPRLLVFGEDVGAKGGVHGVTTGLQQQFGEARVFDTSLSEEGIIGRAVGMAIAGLVPVPEIQFRKYAEPATEQLVDCGTMRWRTANRFAAPMVVRMPGGFAACGDPWHSQTNEVFFAHAVGWRVAYPSNAEDAVGLLRAALRGNDPVMFFEHRALLDAPWARRPYPGDDCLLPFGCARTLRSGGQATVVTWGAMVERCEAAIAEAGVDATLIDLRTLVPWDRATVLESVRATGRCPVVHEDTLSAGFGAEIAAVVSEAAFFSLESPVARLAMPDIPSPHSPELLEAAVPGVAAIAARLRELVSD